MSSSRRDKSRSAAKESGRRKQDDAGEVHVSSTGGLSKVMLWPDLAIEEV